MDFFRKLFGGSSRLPEHAVGIGLTPEIHEEVVNRVPYEKVLEEYVDEAIRRTNENVRRVVEGALLDSWGNQRFREESLYDGFFLRKHRSYQELVASPLKLLKQAGILTLEFVTPAGVVPLWVHASSAVNDEMTNLANHNGNDNKFMSFVHPSASQIDAGARHIGVSELCELLKCRNQGRAGIIYPRLRGAEWYRLGPDGFEVTSDTYRVDRSLLAMIGKDMVSIRPPKMEDWDQLGSIVHVLQDLTGKAVGTSSFDGFRGNHLITSVYAKEFVPSDTSSADVVTQFISQGLLGTG